MGVTKQNDPALINAREFVDLREARKAALNCRVQRKAIAQGHIFSNAIPPPKGAVDISRAGRMKLSLTASHPACEVCHLWAERTETLLVGGENGNTDIRVENFGRV